MAESADAENRDDAEDKVQGTLDHCYSFMSFTSDVAATKISVAVVHI